jgi:hypothetical protein
MRRAGKSFRAAKRPGTLAEPLRHNQNLAFVMTMVMVAMMMPQSVRRNGQTTQNDQGYYSKKHGTDLHNEISPSPQPSLFQTV